MSQLRRIPFFLAVLLFALSVGVDLGGAKVAAQFMPASDAAADAMEAELAGMDQDDADSVRDELSDLSSDSGSVGLALPALAMLDGLLLLTVALMALGQVVGDRVAGLVHGPATLLVSLIMIIVAVLLALLALALLIQMLTLFLAPPFGTLAYLALFGFFARGAASAALSVTMLLKLGGCIALLIAHPRILQSKGLLFLALTALVGGLLTNFLHGFVPIILTSITDAIATLVICVLVLLWSLFLLIGSIPSIVKALTP